MDKKAVIFDLFGTLVDNFDGRPYRELYQRMAELLGMDGEAFCRTWLSEPFVWRRASGQYERFEDCLHDVCAAMGATYDAKVIPAVLELRMQVVRENMRPRPDAIATLKAIRQRGLKIGLVSDCSWEVPVHWPDTPMAPLVDAAIFSCTAKLKKPDPRIYELICEKLAVRAQDCLYIGDCGSDELEGARGAGMDAALICVPYEEEAIMGRAEAQRWTGPRVSSVAEVLRLITTWR